MPMTATSEPHQLRAGSEDWLLARLPDEIHSRLTPDLKEALARATAPRRWGEHPIDIRLSIPLPFGRYYLALVLGPERRSEDRRKAESNAHRVMTPANLAFIVSMIVAFYGALGVGVLLLTRIIE
jgi:hypothetical protein